MRDCDSGRMAGDALDRAVDAVRDEIAHGFERREGYPLGPRAREVVREAVREVIADEVQYWNLQLGRKAREFR